MSQATGLPTHTFTNLIEENIPYEEAVKRLRYINFVCPPGKCYAYQNVTYSLISDIIQKKTRETYDQYVKEKLFLPLGMTSASFGLDGLKASNNFALPNIMTARGRWNTTDIEENYYHIYPAAGANASIRDMSRWVLAQIGHNPDVLSPAILSELHAKVTINTPAQSHYGAREGVTDTHYGLGWRVFDYRGDKNFVHHGGWVKGFRSEVVFSPELQIGMVFLTNSETRLARDIIFKFLDSYEDDKQGVKKVAAITPKRKNVQ
jgi:beta-lactamase class C